MTTTSDQTSPAPVKRSKTVKASAEHAFQAFTEDIDTWWPRNHHIGKTPMKIVGRPCYTEQIDGTECDFGQVLVWDPPHRFVIAWQMGTTFQYEPDQAKSTEVEVQFEPESGGLTRVSLEHRYFERLGPTAAASRNAYGSPKGWEESLQLFRAQAEHER